MLGYIWSMEDREMTKQTEAPRDILAEIAEFRADKRKVGLWSGHDGPELPEVQNPIPATEPRDMVSGQAKSVCPHCHTYCDGDCQANA